MDGERHKNEVVVMDNDFKEMENTVSTPKGRNEREMSQMNVVAHRNSACTHRSLFQASRIGVEGHCPSGGVKQERNERNRSRMRCSKQTRRGFRMDDDGPIVRANSSDSGGAARTKLLEDRDHPKDPEGADGKSMRSERREDDSRLRNTVMCLQALETLEAKKERKHLNHDHWWRCRKSR